MKRILSVIILLLFCLDGYADPRISEKGSSINAAELRKSLGGNFFAFFCMKKSQFNYTKQMISFSVKNNKTMSKDEKDTVLQKVNAMEFAADQYFFFEIRHIKPYSFKDGITMAMNDAAGQDLIDDILHSTGRFDDGVFFNQWIVKVHQAVVKSNFTDEALPIVFSAEFLEQKKRYEITAR